MSHFLDYSIDMIENSWTEVGTSAANSQLIVTHAAALNRHHVVFLCEASFSSSTGVGLLQLKFGEAVVASKTIHAGGRIELAAKGFENPTPNQKVSATLSAGGVGIVGKVTLIGYSTGYTEIGYGVPFDPSQIPSLLLWLRADSLALNDGDPVSTWADRSGKAHNATAAGGVRPIYHTTVTELTSYPIVQFDGTDDVMTGAFTEFHAVTDPVDIFCVAKTSLTTLVRGLIDVAIDTVDTGSCLFVNAGNLKCRRGTAAEEATVAYVETAAYHIFSATSTNGRREIYLDGVTQNSSLVDKSMAVVPSAYSLGARYGGGTMSGFIAEMIVARGGWAYRAQVERYLSLKYNLPVA